MRIDYIRLKYFKRFRLANIADFEATFPEAITIIIAESGKGKSSLLAQLNPLPAVRTDFEKDGYKEIHLTHNGHTYKLIADFSNRNSPHSFIMDGEELNLGHTTDVQTELVQKHFDVSNLVYNLANNKIKLTDITKSERKDLFLKLNPMDLGLIVDTYKKAYGKLKDAKAIIQMEQERKAQLEEKLLSTDALAKAKCTMEQIQHDKRGAEQLIFMLNQHIANIKQNHQEALAYYQQKELRHEELIPKDEILSFCKSMYSKLLSYTQVARGDKYNIEREQINACISKLKTKADFIKGNLKELSTKIDEYHKHLETTSDSPISKLENEIKTLDKELAQFHALPDNPLTPDELTYAQSNFSRFNEDVLNITAVSIHLDTPEIVSAKYNESQGIHASLTILYDKQNKLKSQIEELTQELTTSKAKASIPETCPGTCGLRNVFQQNLQLKESKLITLKTELEPLAKQISEQEAKFKVLKEYLAPYQQYKLVTLFLSIKNWLATNVRYNWTDEKLADVLNTQQANLIKQVDEYLSLSSDYHRYSKLKTQRDKLQTELDATIKSVSVSSEFLTKELQAKETEVAKQLKELNTTEQALTEHTKLYELYLDYAQSVEQAKAWKNIYDQGYDALIVKNAIDYWEKIKQILINFANSSDLELSDLHRTVEEQNQLQHTYTTEVLAQLKKATQEKSIYEKLTLALSPTKGIPYKSMLKYMNVLINNVNYFISQIWSYPLAVKSLVEGDNLDYTLAVKVGSEVNKDISQLSDGQSEVMNLAWVITILLQLKLLNKIPFYADEITRCMDGYHRNRTISFLNKLMDSKLIEQLFVINHFVSVTEGFKTCNIVCLSTDNLTDVPENANEHVTITAY